MAVSGVKEFEIKADPATVMKAVAAVDRLPEWSSAHKKITIDYTFEGDDKVTWTLVESGQQNQQDGSYVLTPTDGGTKVTFELTIDPKIPLPGFLVKKAQKTALETASKGLTKFVENF
jgi:hypothetical protein